jgi:acyl carrier protein
MLEGQVYITGRLKDMVILNGANYYPQDIEASVEDHESIRAGGCIAFADDSSGRDELVIVAELERQALGGDFAALADATAARIFHDHEISASRIYFIKTGHALKTSSGKVQRRATRDAIRQGTMEILYSWSRSGEQAVMIAAQREAPMREMVTETREAIVRTPTLTAAPSTIVAKAPAADVKPKVVRNSIERKLSADPVKTASVLTTLEAWFLSQPDMGIKSIEPDAPLSRYGVDSVAIISLQSFIEEQFKTKIPQDFFFDNPSLRLLAEQVSKSAA